MHATADIGARVKELRIRKKMTLKQLSEACGLSVGFLSQFERGLSSIAIDSLEGIAQILAVPLSDFWQLGAERNTTDPVVHGITLQSKEISPQIYQGILNAAGCNFSMLPRLFTLLPFQGPEEAPELYTHEGEEFVYVLEGVITFFLNDGQYLLYPGDSMHIHSDQPHNWMNASNRIARILTVNTPNPLEANK